MGDTKSHKDSELEETKTPRYTPPEMHVLNSGPANTTNETHDQNKRTYSDEPLQSKWQNENDTDDSDEKGREIKRGRRESLSNHSSGEITPSPSPEKGSRMYSRRSRSRSRSSSRSRSNPRNQSRSRSKRRERFGRATNSPRNGDDEDDEYTHRESYSKHQNPEEEYFIIPGLDERDLQEKQDINILIPGKSVGAIIGKGGATIREIRSKSRCSLVVKDEYTAPYPEDRVLKIDGELQDLPIAEKLIIEQIRTDGVAREDPNFIPILRQQKKNLFGYRKIFENESSDELHRSGKKSTQHASRENKGELNDYWLVPSEHVGKLIGKGGSGIEAIRRDTGASVRAYRADEMPPGCQERRVVITGTRNEIEDAKDMIRSIVGGRPNENLSEIGGSGSSVPIPYRAAGYLIGERGKTIKEISDASKARLIVGNQEDIPFGGINRLVHIQGSQSEIDKAKELVNEKVAEYQKGIDNKSKKFEDEITLKLLIPVEFVSSLIGKRGQQIKKISDKSGAHANFLTDGEWTDNCPDRICCISGRMENVFHAQALVLLALRQIMSFDDMDPRGRSNGRSSRRYSNDYRSSPRSPRNDRTKDYSDDNSKRSRKYSDDYRYSKNRKYPSESRPRDELRDNNHSKKPDQSYNRGGRRDSRDYHGHNQKEDKYEKKKYSFDRSVTPRAPNKSTRSSSKNTRERSSRSRSRTKRSSLKRTSRSRSRSSSLSHSENQSYSYGNKKKQRKVENYSTNYSKPKDYYEQSERSHYHHSAPKSSYDAHNYSSEYNSPYQHERRSTHSSEKPAPEMSTRVEVKVSKSTIARMMGVDADIFDKVYEDTGADVTIQTDKNDRAGSRIIVISGQLSDVFAAQKIISDHIEKF